MLEMGRCRWIKKETITGSNAQSKQKNKGDKMGGARGAGGISCFFGEILN